MYGSDPDYPHFQHSLVNAFVLIIIICIIQEKKWMIPMSKESQSTKRHCCLYLHEIPYEVHAYISLISKGIISCNHEEYRDSKLRDFADNFARHSRKCHMDKNNADASDSL